MSLGVQLKNKSFSNQFKRLSEEDIKLLKVIGNAYGAAEKKGETQTVIEDVEISETLCDYLKSQGVDVLYPPEGKRIIFYWK